MSKELKLIGFLIFSLLFSGYFFMDLKSHYPTSLGSLISLVLFSLPTIYFLKNWSGPKKTLLTLIGLSIFAIIVETIGVKTGIPYGQFHYSQLMGRLLFDLVPWTLPLAWVPLVLGSVAIAKLRFIKFWPTILGSTLLLVIADLVLDPGAVAAGLWVWRDSGVYYGVPLTNFLGWIVSGSLGSALAYWVLFKDNPQVAIPVRISYSALLTIVFWTGVGLKLGMLIPVLAGFIWAGLVIAAIIYYGRLSGEYVVLVDEHNQVIGTAPKLDTHNQNTPLHRAFSIFMFNTQGKVLLQQRAWTKKTWPGVWSNSCCGHLWLHESPEVAAQRRTKYELGIGLKNLLTIVPNYRYRVEKQGIVENEICPILVGLSNDQPQPNELEVASIAWLDWDEFMDKVYAEPIHYSPWCTEEARLLNINPEFKNWLNNIRKKL